MIIGCTLLGSNGIDDGVDVFVFPNFTRPGFGVVENNFSLTTLERNSRYMGGRLGNQEERDDFKQVQMFQLVVVIGGCDVVVKFDDLDDLRSRVYLLSQ